MEVKSECFVHCPITQAIKEYSIVQSLTSPLHEVTTELLKKLSPLKDSLNLLLPKNDLETLLCLTPDDFTRQRGEVSSYENLGTVFISLGEYDKAKEYLEKALAIKTRIVDKQGEAAIYSNLGTVFKRLREYDKAMEYLEKALAIKKKIGDKTGEATSYGN